MATRTNTDHVVGVLHEVHCEFCAQSFETSLMPIARLTDMLSGFLLMHRRCEKPVEPSKQVELFDALAAKEAAHVWPEAAGIDGMSDSPDPETDPPEHDKPALTDKDDAFGRAYPMARDHFRLHTNLSVVLQGVLAPTMEQLKTLPVGSLGFDKIAHWTRLELARMNLTEHPELEVYLPTAGLGMPKELVAMRKELKAKEKPKRGARPLTQPKRRRSGANAE